MVDFFKMLVIWTAPPDHFSLLVVLGAGQYELEDVAAISPIHRAFSDAGGNEEHEFNRGECHSGRHAQASPGASLPTHALFPPPVFEDIKPVSGCNRVRLTFSRRIRC